MWFGCMLGTLYVLLRCFVSFGCLRDWLVGSLLVALYLVLGLCLAVGLLDDLLWFGFL